MAELTPTRPASGTAGAARARLGRLMNTTRDMILQRAIKNEADVFCMVNPYGLPQKRKLKKVVPGKTGKAIYL
jgi:hypothetical protein